MTGADLRVDQHTLAVERIIDAAAQSIFDAFIAMYDSDPPDWVTGAQLDLRPAGRWSVAFQVPDGPAFREERVIIAVEPPYRLAYVMTAIYDDAPNITTTVQVSIDAVTGGHRIRLTQTGFASAETRDEFAAAWPDVLDELARRVHAPRRHAGRPRRTLPAQVDPGT